MAWTWEEICIKNFTDVWATNSYLVCESLLLAHVHYQVPDFYLFVGNGIEPRGNSALRSLCLSPQKSEKTLEIDSCTCAFTVTRIFTVDAVVGIFARKRLRYLLLANLLLTYWDRLFFHRWNVPMINCFVLFFILFKNHHLLQLLVSWILAWNFLIFLLLPSYQSVKCDKLRTHSNNPLYKYTRC